MKKYKFCLVVILIVILFGFVLIRPIKKDFDINSSIPVEWLDSGIFSDYYDEAYDKLNTMTLDEKIGQLLLVRVPDDSNYISDYQFGGYVFYSINFKNKSEEEVEKMIETFQNSSKIPLLIAVDEEGGKVVRVSSNNKLVKERFKSSRELYLNGGFDLIKEDTINKSNILSKLGINLNLAPVVDISTDPNDYIYERTIGEDFNITSIYSKTVIEASKNTLVSYTLKHFPGYGNNADTHKESSVDNRSYEEIEKSMLPFKAGIKADAEAIMFSHNIVNSIDNTNPISISFKAHELLRNELGFTGIIITDDIAMGAVSTIDDVTTKAILSGNDLIITTDYEASFNEIKEAIRKGIISEEEINKHVFKVLAWKYYKKLVFD